MMEVCKVKNKNYEVRKKNTDNYRCEEVTLPEMILS